MTLEGPHMPHLAKRPTFARAAAATTALALLAAGHVVVAGPAQAGESPLPGFDLPIPAVDVTGTDTNLGKADREVVVAVTGPDGLELTKLRAASPAAAVALAAAIDAQPGMAAEPNEVITVSRTRSTSWADVPSRVPQLADPALTPLAAHASRAKPTTAVPVRIGKPGSTAGTVSALAAETLGSQQWGLTAVGAEGAWPITRGAGVVVAVVDTGADPSHPDLAGRLLPEIDLVGDGATGDPMGHGTHVSGIIAAALDGKGIAGLANEVQVLPVRALDAEGSGDVYTVADGINQAVAAGASVVNLSLGALSANSVLRLAVADAHNRGVSVVAAVGNSYTQGNATEYPAGFANVIGVSSVATSGRSSSFANSGGNVDLSAPGEDILSTVPGGLWEPWDGTSMATPFVSAAAALVRAANPSFGPAQVAATLTSTAADDSSGNGRDSHFGYGILRADRAVAKAARAPYGVAAPAATAKVTAISGRSKLRVDINPNRVTKYWSFQVQSRNAQGEWVSTPKNYKTRGAAQTLVVNLPAGAYRVVVPPKVGYLGAISAAVRLVR